MRFALCTSLATVAVVSGAAFAADSPSSSSPPSISAPQFDLAAEYRKGVEALKANQFSEAKKAFSNVLSSAPRDANANFLAGMADVGLNDLKGAQKHYEKAVKANTKLVVAQKELGVTSAKLGDREKAEKSLASLKSLQASCGACADAENIKQAISAVEAAMASPPQAMLETHPPLLFASANQGDSAYLEAVGLINERRYEDAIRSLQRAKASFGAHPDILTYLGFANRKLHRYAIAEDYYRQALAAAPNHTGATEYYGELMVERGDLAGARKMLSRLDSICSFGCAEADELRLWIKAGHSPAS